MNNFYFNNKFSDKTFNLKMIFFFPNTNKRYAKIIERKKNYKILNKIYHNKSCFTQGFFIKNDFLYESCGLYNKSSLNKINLKNGKTIKTIKINPQFFAEGLTISNNIIYILTYKSKTLLTYDMNFNYLDKYEFETSTNEGWGLTHNDKYLILSDGSNKLSFYHFPKENTNKLIKEKEVIVMENNTSIYKINELEYINDYIYANIWYNDFIIKIDPENGKVVNKYNLEYFKNIENTSVNVLNGIAYDKKTELLYITGKNWKYIYSIKLLD